MKTLQAIWAVCQQQEAGNKINWCFRLYEGGGQVPRRCFPSLAGWLVGWLGGSGKIISVQYYLHKNVDLIQMIVGI